MFNKECKIIEQNLLEENDSELKSIKEIHPGEQAIGAAIENFLLASSEMGYGACCMTGPVKYKNKIEKLIGFKKDGYSLKAMISLGMPSKIPVKSTPHKSLDEVVDFI